MIHPFGRLCMRRVLQVNFDAWPRGSLAGFRCVASTGYVIRPVGTRERKAVSLLMISSTEHVLRSYPCRIQPATGFCHSKLPSTGGTTEEAWHKTPLDTTRSHAFHGGRQALLAKLRPSRSTGQSTVQRYQAVRALTESSTGGHGSNHGRMAVSVGLLLGGNHGPEIQVRTISPYSSRLGNYTSPKLSSSSISTTNFHCHEEFCPVLFQVGHIPQCDTHS